MAACAASIHKRACDFCKHESLAPDLICKLESDRSDDYPPVSRMQASLDMSLFSKFFEAMVQT